MATARAGNVIGGGDWSADRLVPDAIRAWGSDETLLVRRLRPCGPGSTYLSLCLDTFGFRRRSGMTLAWPVPTILVLVRDEAATVREVITRALPVFGKGKIQWGEGTEGPHEAGLLTLEISKSPLHARRKSALEPNHNHRTHRTVVPAP